MAFEPFVPSSLRGQGLLGQLRSGCARAVASIGMRVGVQRCGGTLVSQRLLHSDEVTTCMDESRGVEVTEVVQAEAGDASRVAGTPPAPVDRVVGVRRALIITE